MSRLLSYGEFDDPPTEAPIPAVLDAGEFHAAWAQWLDHRRRLGSPSGPLRDRLTLRALAEWGVIRAVVAIRYSIERGWPRILEPPVE